MKKIIMLLTVIPILCFAVFFINKPLEVSASTPDLSIYLYQYNMSEFTGDYVIINNNGYIANDLAYFDSASNIVYTNLPYCAAIIINTDLYRDTVGSNLVIVFTDIPLHFNQSILHASGERYVYSYISSFNTTGFAFATNTFEGSTAGNYNLTAKVYNKHPTQDFGTFGILYVGDPGTSRPIYTYNSVAYIYNANYELNDFKPPFKSTDLIVDYEIKDNPFGSHSVFDGSMNNHVFTFTALRDCVVDLSIYDTGFNGFSDGSNPDDYIDNLWWRYSGINQTNKNTSIISADNAIGIRDNSIDFEANFTNYKDWFYEVYINDLHKRYYNLTGKRIVPNLPFFDEFDIDWSDNTYKSAGTDLVLWARDNNILVDYSGSIVLKVSANFKGDYFALQTGETKTITVSQKNLSLLNGQYYFVVTYAGEKEKMFSSGVSRNVLTSRNVNDGYYVYSSAYQFAFEGFVSSTKIDDDKFNPDDIFNDNNIYDDDGNVIGQIPNENTNINGDYGNTNVGLDGLISNGNFDLVAGMGNIGNTMTGFFGMMAGFFSFLPAVIWTLIGVLITICIALRILGR